MKNPDITTSAQNLEYDESESKLTRTILQYLE
jgi:hypothetical protein